jgi:chloramphenicol O-acetyltransferase type A
MAYSASANPHFSLCANLDLTAFHQAVKQSGSSFTVAMVYALSRAANAIPEFRYRIRGETVVEHDVVHPSITIMADDDLFTFCTIEYTEDFPDFAARATRMMAFVREHPTLKDDPGRDDYIFMTAIPWVSFTAFAPPGHVHPAHSIPQFAWGKLFEEGKLIKMPINVQVHHALVDGVHVGRFFERLQDCFHRPELVLGESAI